jgi:hypothetical protein
LIGSGGVGPGDPVREIVHAEVDDLASIDRAVLAVPQREPFDRMGSRVNDHQLIDPMLGIERELLPRLITMWLAVRERNNFTVSLTACERVD